MDLLAYDFFRNALIGVVLISIASALIGTYIVTRRLVSISGGITHACFGGLGLGYFLGWNPLLGAAFFAIASSLGVQWMSARHLVREDSAIAVVWALGMAIGTLFIFLTPGYVPELNTFLFGNILTISSADLWAFAIFTVVLILFMGCFFHSIVICAFDADFARVKQLPVTFISTAMTVLVAVCIVLTIRLVGVMLLMSMLTLPQMIAETYTHRFRSIMLLSVAVSLVCSIAGVILATVIDVPCSALIVLTMAAAYIAARVSAAIMRNHIIPLYFTLLSLTYCAVSCSAPQGQEMLNHAESLIETHPDSALTILTEIDKDNLTDREQQARYALLMSMALDKNYIDTTTFDVLQPAIDYYLKKGTPDEKLKTYYYQGRIFQNGGDRDNALNSFIKGIDIAPSCNDSLVIARTLVAQGYLYYEFYDFNGYVDNYLRAATIYNKKSHIEHEFDCLLNALNGAVILEDKTRADSLYNLCNNFGHLNQTQYQFLQGYNFSYILKFGSKQEIKDYIEHWDINTASSINEVLKLAFAYHKLDDNNQAKRLLDSVIDSDLEYDTLKYQSIAVVVLEGLGDYKDAFLMYCDFSHRSDSINRSKFDQKAKSVEEKHQIELNAQKDTAQKAKIIWGCIGGIAILLGGVFILLLLVRSNKAQKELAVQREKAKDFENAKLKSESEKLALEKDQLALENKNLQLERDNKALEAENLAHRVETLENESENLKRLIESQEELPSEVQEAIKVRIEMLNSLLASYITANDQYEKPYDVWVKELTENKDAFMNSNRLAFQASHPLFIKYFEDHGLTTEEINYVCLYAIGLRGKEVGNYMKKRSHVNTSSAIRKKLGIDKHETNIGIYVRNLLKNV